MKGLPLCMQMYFSIILSDRPRQTEKKCHVNTYLPTFKMNAIYLDVCIPLMYVCIPVSAIFTIQQSSIKLEKIALFLQKSKISQYVLLYTYLYANSICCWLIWELVLHSSELCICFSHDLWNWKKGRKITRECWEISKSQQGNGFGKLSSFFVSSCWPTRGHIVKVYLDNQPSLTSSAGMSLKSIYGHHNSARKIWAWKGLFRLGRLLLFVFYVV